MTPKALFSKYLKNVADVARQSDTREESFYPVLAERGSPQKIQKRL